MLTTIVTSDLGDRICEKYGVKVEKTLTGFKFIGAKIADHRKNDDYGFVFGYEESYGCLISDFVRDKDGVQASLMLCEAAAYYKNFGMSLIDVLEKIYAEHGFFLDSQSNFYFPGLDGKEKIAALTASLRANVPCEVGGVKIVRVEDYLTDKMHSEGFPYSDVLRFIFEDGSWVAVRPSGTEPKCKFYYCVCAPEKDSAEKKYEALKKAFEPVI
jgi:phosphoglucomutase